MIHAYNELYLNDARRNLANAFDYAINTCHIDPDDFMHYFISSSYCQLFEEGNPGILSGISGFELAKKILEEIHYPGKLQAIEYHQEKSKEYWAGWALSYYQWWNGKRFRKIFSKIPLSEIISMYEVFHQMDICQFVESMDYRYEQRQEETNLKRYRQAFGLSQKELSLKADVSLRNIQLYEQRVNSIDKAQANTLYRLALVLHCQIEDLLENPEK
jgi:DNA-binding XRE family transcriptional regulator